MSTTSSVIHNWFPSLLQMSRVWVISPSSVRWRFWRATAPSRGIRSSAASPVTGGWASVRFLQTFILPSHGFRISPSLLFLKRVPIRVRRRRLYLRLQRLRSSTPLKQPAGDLGPLPPALKQTRALPLRSLSPRLYLQTHSRSRTPLRTRSPRPGTRRSHDHSLTNHTAATGYLRTNRRHPQSAALPTILCSVCGNGRNHEGAVIEMLPAQSVLFLCLQDY